ncbi:3-hydroxyisobutyrate dehydrogenase [Nannochloropsis oceanica]
MGFIGLGQMGSRMASNLLSKTDLPVVIYDTNPKAMAILQGKGARLASSVEEIAQTTQIIMTMLPATQHVEAVVGQVLIPHAKAGTLLIDGSTIDPTASKALAAQALTRGLEMVDAPVSGGIGGAEAGTLTFMVGGEAKSVEKAEAFILKHMGKKVVHCGGPGTGAVAKICNNLVLGVNMIGVAEAMRLGVALGMDPLILNGVLNSSSGRSWVTELYNPCPGVIPSAPSSNDYQGGFTSRLMQKDLGIAGDVANKVGGVPLPLGAVAQQVYALMQVAGWGGKDFSSVYKFLEGASIEGKRKG